MSEVSLRVDIPTPGRAFSGGRSATSRPTLALQQDHFENVKSTALLSAFFHRSDLEDLLAQSGGSGLRFYPALDSRGGFSLLAVATNFGNDIVSGDTPCFVAEGRDSAARLTREQGVDLLKHVNNQMNQAARSGRSASTPFFTNEGAESAQYSKVSYSGSDINQLLGPGVVGLQFFSTQIVFSDGNDSFNTLAVVAIDASGQENGAALMSTLPCPPNCGGGAYVNHSSTLDS
jgi:hypothetical protein